MKKLKVMFVMGMLFVLSVVAVTAQTQQVCEPADVVLVVDTSGSMDTLVNGGPDTRMDVAKAAAVTFVQLLQLEVDDKGALVSFATTSAVEQALTNDETALVNAINGLSAGGNTCISCGVNEGQGELNAHGRSGITHAIVLLSDGDPTVDTEADALAAASAAKGAGTLLYTIGIGDANDVLLEGMATSPSHFFSDADATNLENIYSQIASSICEQPPDEPEVPEFSAIGAGLALVGAGLVLRKKRNKE